uniref:RAB39B, member RAS oncogene family n=1 Tax=Stegastes partitus TaxID=144197 RepID=A0A3B5A2V2_9TELE
MNNYLVSFINQVNVLLKKYQKTAKKNKNKNITVLKSKITSSHHLCCPKVLNQMSCLVLQEKEKQSITRAYYRNSVGGLLLFDITNRRSFQNVHDWLEEARSHVQPHSIVFLLVGHKCDLEAQRQVTRQEAEKLAGAYGMRYVETSARDAINVEHAFTELTRDIFALVRSGDITIQEGWEGVKSGFVPNVVHSSEEVTKSDRRCLC